MDNEINEFLEKSVDEYIPFEKVLKTHGLTYQEGLRKSKEYYCKFRNLLGTFKIDTTSNESIYLSICELAEKSPNNDLLKLYCMVLTDNGFLMDNKNPMRTDEQNILSWLEQSQQCEEVYRYVKNQSILESKLQDTISTLDDKTSKKDVSLEALELFHIVTQYNIYYDYRHSNILLNNIESLLKILHSNQKLRKISTYVCFAVFTRKQSFMAKHSGYTPNLRVAFEYQKYTIDRNNGKNFNNYLEYVQLYENLRRYYVYNELSDYCFLKYSNLGEWYQLNGEPIEGVPMPFLSVINQYLGEIVLDFSNYEVIENPVADQMLLNTIYNYPDMLKKFISARFFNQDTSNIVREFYSLSKVEDKYPNNEDLAEIILIGETAQYIEEIFIKTAKNFLSIESSS